MVGNRGQVSIFVIIGIVIVLGVVVFFAVRGSLQTGGVSAELAPVFDYYLGCIDQEVRAALDLAGSGGGRIDPGIYEQGSGFMPQGNQLNFLGRNVPYWFYVSGNGIVKENVPSLGDIEQEIGNYAAERIVDCDFEEFYRQGFEVEVDHGNVDIKIEDGKIDVKAESLLSVTKGEDSAIRRTHELEVGSEFGSFYNEAREIYQKQRDGAFLEEYGVDVLRLYAPVDGVEVSCSPKVWQTNEIFEDLKGGLEGNLGAVKFEGNYYELQDEDNRYFVVDEQVESEVNVLYSRDWPTKIEILDADGPLLVANPVGNQEGLGALGFCYVSYHFVYDLSFPVMIQMYNNEEIFQFPVVVVIDNNLAREVDLEAFSEAEDSVEICEFANKDIEVEVFDKFLNSVEAQVDYKCFDQVCSVGSSEGGKAIGKVPGCVGGKLVVNAEGFAYKEQEFSSNEESRAEVILQKEYEVEVEVRVDGQSVDGSAVVSFKEIGSGGGASAFYPDGEVVRLSEGLYDLEVQVYGKSGVVIPGGTKTECFESSGGIAGLFGITREECVDIEIQDIEIDQAIVGGGKGEEFLSDGILSKGKLVVNAEGLPEPRDIEGLQYNLEILDSLNAYLEVVG